MLSPAAHPSLVCPQVQSEERSRPYELHDDQGRHAGTKKRASPILDDFDDAASGLETPPLHTFILKEVSSPRKRRRRALASPVAQEQQIRRMLKLAEESPTGNPFFGMDSSASSLNLTMNRDQLNRKRDLGLAMLVMVSNTFDTSTRTFVLAISIFDRFLAKTITVEPSDIMVPLATQHDLATTTQAVEMPLACFIMACKFCETYAPRLADIVNIISNRCTVQQLREAENNILACLHWDIDSLTALDLLDKLLGFSTPRRAQQIKRKAEMGVKVACCSRSISKQKPAVLAVGVLLNACEQQDLTEDYLAFVPNFLITDEARMCAQQLKSFIADHVRSNPKQKTESRNAMAAA